MTSLTPSTKAVLDAGDSPHQADEVRSSIEAVGQRLIEVFSALIGSLPDRPARPMELARSINVDKNLAHRLFTATQKSDPLEALLAMPGAGLLEQVAAAAEQQGVEVAICTKARRTARDFDALVKAISGHRSAFDAMISDWVPSVREQVSTTARQTVFRGMREVLGVSAELQACVYAFVPNATSPDRIDALGIGVTLDIQRLKPSGKLCLTIGSRLGPRTDEAVSSRQLLPEFCSSPTPTYRLLGSESDALYAIEWDNTIGRGSTRSVVVSEMHRKVLNYASGDGLNPLVSCAESLDVPVNRLLLNVLFHRDVQLPGTPWFRAISAAGGRIDPNDPLTEHWQIPMEVPVQAVGMGKVLDLPTPELPFYKKLLVSQLERFELNHADFRAYRLRVDYPVYNAHQQLVFPRPVHPSR